MSQASDELRERFQAIDRKRKAQESFRRLMDAGETRKAAEIAGALGDPLPRHQVVRVDFARART